MRILPIRNIWRNVAGFVPAIVWALCIAVLSLLSASIVPPFSWSQITGTDKVLHLLGYLLLGVLVFLGIRKMAHPPEYAGWIVVAGCIFFGVLIEILQKAMRAGRHFDYGDIVANVIGVFIAYCIFNFFLKRKTHGS